MVSKVLCFCGVLIMSFCVGRILPDEYDQPGNKKRLSILLVFGLLMFLLFFYRMDNKLQILSSIICAVVITGIDYELEKYLPF